MGNSSHRAKEPGSQTQHTDACIEEQQTAARAHLSGVGAAAVAAPTNMERCLEALNVQDGSAAPPRPPTPPTTTDRISYEDSLRFARLSKPTCDNITPLKGILKSGVPREEHQKVVCFSGPTTDEPPPPLPKHKYYPPGTQPHYNEEEDYCDRFKEPGVEESAARRAQNICAYDVIPSPETVRAVGEDVQEQKQLPGYLGSRGVDCKEVTWTRVFCCTAVAAWLQSFRTASEGDTGIHASGAGRIQQSEKPSS